jgi:hypothetical protein
MMSARLSGRNHGVGALEQVMQTSDLDWLTAWMDTLSPTGLAIFLSVVVVGLTWFGIIFFKPFIRRWLRKQPGSNDLVNYASAGFSLFYGLLLGLLSVTAFGNASSVSASVDREAASIASLYRTVASYPEPLRGEVQYLLRDYTQYIIHKDWPAHNQGKIWNGGNLRLQVIQQKLISLQPTDHTQSLLQEQAIKYFGEIDDARQERLTGVNTAIPGVLWYVMIIGALINILLIWLLDMRFTLHLILGGIISFFLGVMIFLIAAMDRPLQGGVSVTADAYKLMYDHVMQWDET